MSGMNKGVVVLSSLKSEAVTNIRVFALIQSRALLFVFCCRSTELSTKQLEWQDWKRLSRAMDVSNLSWTPVEAYVPRIAINLLSNWNIASNSLGSPDIYLLHQSLHLLLVGVSHTSVLSLSLRTPRSTPVKLSSAAIVSILMNWFSRMAEPTALSDS